MLGGSDRVFTRLGRLLKEKAKSHAGKLFSGFSKTRDKLARHPSWTSSSIIGTSPTPTPSSTNSKRKPAVVMIVGVNVGGKTTSRGKLAYRLKKDGVKILMEAGDTFRAAASDQLEIWAERTGCEIVVAEKENAKASLVLSQAVKRGKKEGYDIVLCDTSGCLHTNYSLMEELMACKKTVGKVVPSAPNGHVFVVHQKL